ncbi:hypothetical protein [Streptomyces laculatispora]|nr:hypothetical protein [Streptomyces laculatispora]
MPGAAAGRLTEVLTALPGQDRRRAEPECRLQAFRRRPGSAQA